MGTLSVHWAAGSGGGWVRVVVERDSMGAKPWKEAQRELFLRSGEQRKTSMSFMMDPEARYRMRIHPLGETRVAVESVSVTAEVASRDLVRLSLGGRPPFVLARRQLAQSGHVAWEIL